MRKKDHLQYVFHPYHGYLPTVIKKEEGSEEQLYKLDPLQGFVPVVDKEGVDESPSRKKRDAQFLISYPPVYQPLGLVPVQVPVQGPLDSRKSAQPEENPE